MRVMLDTEFTDFQYMELISIAFVSEDGQYEFYAENGDHNLNLRSQFVNDVVMPLTDMYLSTYGKSYQTIAADLAAWFNALPGDEPIEVICDYVGDWQLVCKLLKGTPSPRRPIKASFLAHALCDELKARGHDNDNFVGAIPFMIQTATDQWYEIDPRQHHALVDARANRFAWEQILLDAPNWKE